MHKTLSDSEFRKIASFIEQNVGIKMPIEKKLMMQSRLNARLKVLGLTSFKDYIDYVFSNNNNNIPFLLFSILSWFFKVFLSINI